MNNVISFPKQKLAPNTIEVQLDLGTWAIAYFHDRKLVSRLGMPSKAVAEAEALRLAESGFTWRMGDNGHVYITPDGLRGGCWAVAHRSRSDDSDAVLSRHFSIDQAIRHAINATHELGCELHLNAFLADKGGAA
jgi:hypothetical protein